MSKASTVVEQTHEPPKVLVPIAEGTEELEAVTIIDTLSRGGSHITVATVGSDLVVKCMGGVRIVADKLLRDCVGEDWDLIVCPGGMPGATNLSESYDLTGLLLHQNQQNKLLAGICASPAVVFAKHGLLHHGKHATCYPSEKFKHMIHNYTDRNVVVDDNLITSRGPGTALEFSLTLVEMLFGHERVQHLKKEMVIH